MNPSTTLTEVVLPGVVEPDGLIIQERPVPTPGDGQALVEMQAAGVSFAEQGMRRNRYPGQPKFPFVLGYDLVGVVAAVGAGVDPALVGRRVAAVTKSGALDHARAARRRRRSSRFRTASTPPTRRPSWSTASPPGRCCTARPACGRGRRSSSTAPTAASAPRWSSSPATPASASSAPPRPATTTRCASWAPSPIDYNDPRLADRVRELAPDGVDAAFDHLGGPSFKRSFDLLARGGTLVAYGTASQRDDTNNLVLAFTALYARLGLWSLLPNGRRAHFYNFWGGKLATPKRFRRRLAADLTSVLVAAARRRHHPAGRRALPAARRRARR